MTVWVILTRTQAVGRHHFSTLTLSPLEPNTEVYELATHDIHRHESFAASPTSPQQFDGTESPIESRDQHAHSTRLDGDNDTAGDPAAADDSRRSTYRSLTT